jgi:hypothetical protein
LNQLGWRRKIRSYSYNLFREVIDNMGRFSQVNFIAGCVVLLTGATSVFGQGRINTNIETAQTIARKSGRPILAIAGKKT